MTRAVVVLLAVAGTLAAADPAKRFVYPAADGTLSYDADERGNRVPDFSHCGYGGGGVALPAVPVRFVVPPAAGDNGPRIQAALDHVARLPTGAGGFRGAVLLLAGRHEVAGCLRIEASGVVLRGQGQDAKSGTVLVAAGTERRTLIQVRGRADRQLQEGRAIADRHVPVGATRLRLKDARGLKAGDTMLVEHPSSKEWITAVGMNRFPTRDQGSWLDWQPGTLDIRWDRILTRVDGDMITLDAPLTTAIDAAHGGGTVRAYIWPGRLRHVGVENLRCESNYERGRELDEDHAWGGISFEDVQDAWVRQVTFAHFAGSAVSVWEGCKQITVEDCQSLQPVSEIGGYRRHTFYTSGQLTLFQRCKAQQGRHDFAVGYLAAGPNAFVECEATGAHQFSGPIESWASGVLYDNVTIDGGALALTNRETDGHGVGWAAANSVLWQCTAPVVICRMPPTGQNWAIGCWGQFVGDGHWRSLNEFVRPESLYAAQLHQRLGARAVEATRRQVISGDPGDGEPSPASPPPVPVTTRPMALRNGWLVCADALLVGGHSGTVWWRGQVLPAVARGFGAGVTRFVPGRRGPGFTDDLDELARTLEGSGRTVLEHHWGLWYDRRRDDHEMVRRIDGEVWPPFYEQPWARSGQGKAWDGLSKYDLTRFNPWYFARLKEFADRCDQRGLVLVQHMYFQHNVLEAGAHWADFPWRPANCLQDTGFAEPPPYVNKKRIFLADVFYDVTHPVRRQLHRAYIRHCLDVLGGNTNVVFMTGAEYTGSLSFMQFWLDTIAEWERDHGRRVLVGLSCTKDVQDAVLADPVRGPRIAVIDLRYWWYTADGGVYDPKGGANLAPRQQLREWTGSKSRSDASIARQVREYRQRYPGRAILCSLDGASPWAVLAAGGSIPNLPRSTPASLLASLPRLTPLAARTLTSEQWALAEPGREYLIYTSRGAPVRLELPAAAEGFTAAWLDLPTGAVVPERARVHPGPLVEYRPPRNGPAVLWLRRE